MPASPWSRVSVFAELGYAYPVGDTEPGGAVKDVSFGLAPFALGGSYGLTPSWAALLRLRYAVNLPTLCASTSDCAASLGRDVEISVAVSRKLPSWRRLHPSAELWASWEWLGSRLSDSGVVSSRSWNGPSGGLTLFVDLAEGTLWAYGPYLGIEVGTFTHYELNTPAGATDGSPGATVHVWPSLGVRLGRRIRP